jgi:hypothetical protein
MSDPDCRFPAFALQNFGPAGWIWMFLDHTIGTQPNIEHPAAALPAAEDSCF